MKYTLQDIAKITSGRIVSNNENSLISCMIFDSRMAIPASDCLFFAIKTKTSDGHRYIADAYKKNVRNFIVNDYFSGFEKFPDANFIIVKNTVDALQNLAAFHRKNFSIPVIAITGSNGKTIVKEWLTELMNKRLKTLQSPKSYNSQIGVPLSVWELSEQFDAAVFEAGISFPGEMDKLEKILKPNIGVITNIGDAHQQNFMNLEQKTVEKLQLFKNVETIIYSPDYQIIDRNIKKLYPHKRFFIWSLKQNADLQLVDIQKNVDFTVLRLKFNDKIYEKRINFNDSASVENSMTVLATLLAFFENSTPDDFDLSVLENIEMRLQQIQGKNKCTIINDSYNCDLASLRIALNVLKIQNQNPVKTVILSDIFQVGKNENELYSEVANLLKNNGINKFVGVGDTISKYKDLFECKKYFFGTTDELIANINSLNFFDEAILLKGARKFHFEKISNVLQLKNHRTTLEINMSALEHNFDYFRNLLKPDTKIMAMVKAFSYGSGSYEIANFLQRKNADYLAVAIADEGIELRKAGINIPILILNPDTANFDVFVEYNLEPEIYNFRMLDEFYKAVKNKVYNPYPVHLKVNTGMNRLGFSASQIDDLIEKLKNYDKIFIKSVFSHLVGSSEKRFDDFTRKQIAEFDAITKRLENQLNVNFLKHILNSGGIERFPEYQFDMVRLGIGLYGISAFENSKLKHISTLKTKIIQINEVAKGETIGYSRVGVAERDSRIATIPIGYADGFNRRLSNGVGKVRINNKFAPVIGNICMDLTMIDITGIDAEEGDEVVIFDEKFTITELAELLDTIPYEILTSVSSRVKRIYVWE